MSECDFCHGQPILNGGHWVDPRAPKHAACPRCGHRPDDDDVEDTASLPSAVHAVQMMRSRFGAQTAMLEFQTSRGVVAVVDDDAGVHVLTTETAR